MGDGKSGNNYHNPVTSSLAFISAKMASDPLFGFPIFVTISSVTVSSSSITYVKKIFLLIIGMKPQTVESGSVVIGSVFRSKGDTLGEKRGLHISARQACSPQHIF